MIDSPKDTVDTLVKLWPLEFHVFLALLEAALIFYTTDYYSNTCTQVPRDDDVDEEGTS